MPFARAEAGPAGAAVLTGPAATYPSGQTVHGAFLAVAGRFPDRPALVAADRTVSYRALQRAARRVAAALAEAGVGRGDVVPVLLGRGPELVAVLLGILMRGAAYVALDTAWPARRVREVVAGLGAGRAVATSATAGGIPCWTPPDDLFDGCAPPADAPPPADLLDPVGGGDACCVFLTSGSTGTPKRVLSPHRATTRLFGPAAMHADLAPGRRVPQWAPLPWDAFSLELWSMLLTGGTSVLCEQRLPTAESMRRLISAGVDSMWLTSSLFNLLVDEDPGAFAGLRQVWTGGEQLSPAHVRRFLDRHPTVTLVNGYGPVESCVFVTTHEVVPADCDDPHGIPLGRPVAGTTVLVVDGERVCHTGEAGEVCVAGDGLALGYLGDEELTRQRFVTLSLDGRPLRVYRTGDRGLVDARGLLRFLGRADRQVKIRGFRVELDEVETHLRALDAVASAVVLADADGSGGCTGLTGFYVPRDPSGDPQQVRAGLLDRVPHYLVPDRLVAVAAMPVTANGKTDHAALRAIARDAAGEHRATGHDGTNGSVGAASHDDDPELAAAVAVVSSVTGRPCSAATPLAHATLTSLEAIRVCMRLGERYGAPLSPERVLAAGTVADLADLLRTGAPAGGGRPPGSPPVGPPRGHEIELADTQVGFLFEHLLRPAGLAGHCLVSWLVHGRLQTRALRAAMGDVQRRHEALRSSYRTGTPAVLVPRDRVPVSLTELGTFASLDRAWQGVREQLLRPLDIGAAQVWRGVCAGVGDDRHLLGVAVHHVAYDGWSESVLVDDLSVAYAARLAGRAPRWPGPSPRLADAVAARRADTVDAGTDLTRRYWTELLTGVPMPEAIAPVSGREPARVSTRTHRLPPEVLSGVDRLARRLGVTRFSVLAAGYARAVAEVLGAPDVGIAVPVSVRHHASQARVVTCLVDTVCLRLGSPPAGSLAEMAVRAHRQLALARDRHAMPFAEIVRVVNPPRGLGRNPLFRTMFAYQDFEQGPLVLGDAQVVPHRREAPQPMSELVVEVWPDSGGARVEAMSYDEALPAGAVDMLLDAYGRIVAEAGASGRPYAPRR